MYNDYGYSKQIRFNVSAQTGGTGWYRLAVINAQAYFNAKLYITKGFNYAAPITMVMNIDQSSGMSIKWNVEDSYYTDANSLTPINLRIVRKSSTYQHFIDIKFNNSSYDTNGSDLFVFRIVLGITNANNYLNDPVIRFANNNVPFFYSKSDSVGGEEEVLTNSLIDSYYDKGIPKILEQYSTEQLYVTITSPSNNIVPDMIKFGKTMANAILVDKSLKLFNQKIYTCRVLRDGQDYDTIIFRFIYSSSTYNFKILSWDAGYSMFRRYAGIVSFTNTSDAKVDSLSEYVMRNIYSSSTSFNDAYSATLSKVVDSINISSYQDTSIQNIVVTYETNTKVCGTLTKYSNQYWRFDPLTVDTDYFEWHFLYIGGYRRIMVNGLKSNSIIPQ